MKDIKKAVEHKLKRMKLQRDRDIYLPDRKTASQTECFELLFSVIISPSSSPPTSEYVHNRAKEELPPHHTLLMSVCFFNVESCRVWDTLRLCIALRNSGMSVFASRFGLGGGQIGDACRLLSWEGFLEPETQCLWDLAVVSLWMSYRKRSVHSGYYMLHPIFCAKGNSEFYT